MSIAHRRRGGRIRLVRPEPDGAGGGHSDCHEPHTSKLRAPGTRGLLSVPRLRSARKRQSITSMLPNSAGAS